MQWENSFYIQRTPGFPNSNDSKKAVAYGTVVFVRAFHLNDIKVKLISEIVRMSPVDVVLGIDGGLAADDLPKIQEIQKAGDISAVPLHSALAKKNWTKCEGFLLGGAKGTGPLAWLEWFNQSEYEFAWGIEDDVWFHGLPQFIRHFNSNGADLITIPERTHPFWLVRSPASHPWWVRSPHHVLPEGQFCYSEVVVNRVSKAFTNNLLRSLTEEDNSSHLELYYPYVVAKYNMSWTSMFMTEGNIDCNVTGVRRRNCSKYVEHYVRFSTYWGQRVGAMPCLEDLMARPEILLAHPVKYHCGISNSNWEHDFYYDNTIR